MDDNPDNNRYEREALARLGIQFEIAKSTSVAFNKLETRDSIHLML